MTQVTYKHFLKIFSGQKNRNGMWISYHNRGKRIPDRRPFLELFSMYCEFGIISLLPYHLCGQNKRSTDTLWYVYKQIVDRYWNGCINVCLTLIDIQYKGFFYFYFSMTIVQYIRIALHYVTMIVQYILIILHKVMLEPHNMLWWYLVILLWYFVIML